MIGSTLVPHILELGSVLDNMPCSVVRLPLQNRGAGMGGHAMARDTELNCSMIGLSVAPCMIHFATALRAC
jgi:hypothetical protein